MPTQHVLTPGQALIAFAVVAMILVAHVGLATEALADLARREPHVRGFTAETWRVLIVVVAILGPLAYLSYGRHAAG